MLKSLQIQNYKGFLDSQTIEFALPVENKTGSGITILCGKNNSGKSTVFDALTLLKENSQIFASDRINNKQVEIKITDNKAQTKTLRNLNNGALIDSEGQINFSYPDIIFVPANRQWQDKVQTPNMEESSFILSENISRNNFVSPYFSSLLTNIARDEIKKTKLNNLIQEVFPEFNDWTVDADQSGSFIKYTTKSGLEHHSGMLGMGIVSLMRVLTSLITESTKIIFVDEPELSLHPQAQKRLSQIFSRFSTQKQIILITHSPYFISWKDIQNKAKINKTSKPKDEKCLVHTLKNDDTNFLSTIGNINKNKQFTLDTTGKEIFFTDKKIIFCEGQTDVAIFKKFVKDNFLETKIDFEFFGFGCGSGDNIPKFAKLAISLGLTPIALFDNPKPSTNKNKTESDKNIEKAIQECKNIKCPVFTHPGNDIADISKGLEIKTEYQEKVKEIFDKILRVD